VSDGDETPATTDTATVADSAAVADAAADHVTTEGPSRTRILRRLLRAMTRIGERVALLPTTDREGTTARIAEGIRQDGEAPWLLVCSCLLASIGLDLSSSAVVIGAMLISPLMSPILGVGLATAVVDRPMLLRALRELGLASAAALATSTVYFWLSPLAEPTPELVARTTPTLLDVAVAFFGGVAGIVAGSRTRTSLALPGVAIATALMPPLCTAGFGLATGRPGFFFGALYLFVMNAVFIALATFGVARWLRFPVHEFESPAARRRARRLIGGIAAIAVLPSLWFLRTTVLERRARGRIDAFVEAEIERRGHDVLRWTRETTADSMLVRVVIAGRRVGAQELDSVNARLPDYGLPRTRIQPIQSDLSREDLTRATSNVREEVLTLLAAAQAGRDSIEAVRAVRDSVQRVRDSLRLAAQASPLDSSSVGRFGREMQRGFPEIVRLSWLPVSDVLATDSAAAAPALSVWFAQGTTRTVQRDVQQRLEAIARAHFGREALRVEVR